MSRFIQLHMLTSYPPANLNRDDQGSPKTAKMGGYDRLRVSSQCLKRTWRKSEDFEEALANHIGVRTKRMGLDAAKQFVAAGVKEKDAIAWGKKIANAFSDKTEAPKKGEDPFTATILKQPVHLSPEEYNAVQDLIDLISKESREPNDDELSFLRKNTQAVDIALFGRMLAVKGKQNFGEEAACQVAHAISVHPVVIEDDYFTAVEELNQYRDDAGAAHIGETRFAAGLFYSYICINRELLIENLGGDEDLANKAIRALVDAAVKVAPSGKQNSFASRAYASFVLAEKGDQQPRSLSVAYLKPITQRENDNFVLDSIEALIKQKNSFDKVYGDCADDRYELNVPKEEGTLVELLDFVGKQ